MVGKNTLRLALGVLVLGIVPALALGTEHSALGTAYAQTTASYTFVCGTVTGYTAPTATVAGSVTVGGYQIPIAAGTATFSAVPGSAALSAGNDLCLNATLNSTGAITTATVDIGKGATVVNACGVISAFTAPTAAAAGTVTINNLAVPLGEGAALSGTAAATLANGQNVCLNVTAGAGGVASAVTFNTNSVPLAAYAVFTHSRQVEIAF
jgi:hypothetical protein